MGKRFKAFVAALILGSLVVGAALPADAQGRGRGRDRYDHRYDHRYDRRHDNNDAAVAIVAGVLGLAIGAAIADGDNGRGRDPYYNQGYDQYGRPYAYDRRRICVREERVYDWRLDRDVLIRREYPC